jgi:hypothetical protein
VILLQDSYITKIARTFKLELQEAKSPLLVKPLTKFEGETTDHEKHLHQRKVSSIAYAASTTRSDCARALQKLSVFLQNSSPSIRI